MMDLTLFNNNIEEMEAEMLKLPQRECSVTHEFGAGLYIRTVYLPADTCAIGHEQKFPHLNVMLKGKCIMQTPDGIITMTAPCSFIGQPGRKIGYIVEDTVWQNVYSTDKTDPVEAENYFINKSETYINATQALTFSEEDVRRDRDDYALAIQEIGLTEEEAQEQVQNVEDQIDDDINTTYRVAASPIHGNGIFLEQFMPAGYVIGLAKIGDKRTKLGRWTNHSITPNAEMRLGSDGNIYLVASKDIIGRCGGITGEEVTINYRDALRCAVSQLERI